MKQISVLIYVLLGGCAHVQMVAATTSTNHSYEYCLEVTRVFGIDTLFCGKLSEVQAEQQKQQALHPDATYTIVKPVEVAK